MTSAFPEQKQAKATWFFNNDQISFEISTKEMTGEQHFADFDSFMKKCADYKGRPGRLATALWQASARGLLDGVNPLNIFLKFIEPRDIQTFLNTKGIRSDQADAFIAGQFDSAFAANDMIYFRYPAAQFPAPNTAAAAPIITPIAAPLPPPVVAPLAQQALAGGQLNQPIIAPRYPQGGNLNNLQFGAARAAMIVYDLQEGQMVVNNFMDTGLTDSEFIYSKFNAEDAWTKTAVEFNGKETLLMNLCAFAIVVGRLTNKKKQHLSLFSADANALSRDDVELRDLILRFDSGNKVAGYNMSQIVSVALPRYYRDVMRIKQVVSYVKGGAQSESYSSANKVETFDFAAWLPISQSQLETHLAVRFFRAVSLEGYVVPDPSVSLRQVNYSRSFNRFDDVFLDMGNVRVKFDAIASEYKSAFVGVPLEKLTFGINRGDRQKNILMTNESNVATSARSANMISAVKQITATMPNRPP